jgi:hypothetical protein
MSVSDGVVFVDSARTVGVVGIDKAKPKENARITKRVLIAMEGPIGSGESRWLLSYRGRLYSAS